MGGTPAERRESAQDMLRGVDRTRVMAAAMAVAAVLAALAPARAHPGHGCAETRADRWAEASGVEDPTGEVRVYAIQFKHEIRHVRSHQTFDRKMRCLVEELVMPTADVDGDGRADEPTIVVLNEDAGLATIAAGTRGVPARAAAARGVKDPRNIPGALSAFATLGASYQPAVSYYAARAPETSAQRLILAAATDNFVRGFMRTNSAIARDYGVYVVSSNNQAEFRETTDPVAVAALRDPDYVEAYLDGTLTSVYEAVDVGPDPSDPSSTTGMGRAGIDVYNQAFMWAPEDAPAGHPVRTRHEEINGGPLSPDDPRRNIIHLTRKTPLTSIEREVLDLSDDRDMGELNTGPLCLLPADDPSCSIRIGYGISLPAFQWGSAFGEQLPNGIEPCSTPTLWMRCLDARGVNLFLQPEANPGKWADYIDLSWTPTAFQALSWMDSAWRTVADPTVENIRYAVTPHLVGNLVDLTFDGQSVIFERCFMSGDGSTCDGNTPEAFVGAELFVACGPGETARCDGPELAPYAGAKQETIVMAPWVLDDDPALSPVMNRERLAERARQMEAGTGSPFENDYLETAVWADLDFD